MDGMQKCETREQKFTRPTKTKAIKEDASLIGQTATVKGWVRTIREQKTFAFMEVNDGSQLSNIQVIIDTGIENFEQILEKATTGASVAVTGEVKKSPGGKQSVEIHATEIKIIGESPSDYPLQKKRHSFEYLRTIAHLRPRTNTFGAVTRMRNSSRICNSQLFSKAQLLLDTHTFNYCI